MHDLYPGNRYEGDVLLYPDKVNIVGPDVDPIEIRMRIGMVFQKPNPFPKSIYENVAYGMRIRGISRRSTWITIVERALREAALWTEVKDRLQIRIQSVRWTAAAACALRERWRPILNSSCSTSPLGIGSDGDGTDRGVGG